MNQWGISVYENKDLIKWGSFFETLYEILQKKYTETDGSLLHEPNLFTETPCIYGILVLQ